MCECGADLMCGEECECELCPCGEYTGDGRMCETCALGIG